MIALDRQDDKLLPCPFCGNYHTYKFFCPNVGWLACCPNCGAEASLVGWNTRATPASRDGAEGPGLVLSTEVCRNKNCPADYSLLPEGDAVREALLIARAKIQAWPIPSLVSQTNERHEAISSRNNIVRQINEALSPAPVPDGVGETRSITDEDREYASELLADLTSDDLPRLEIAARWFRKARVEHALAPPAVVAEAVGEQQILKEAQRRYEDGRFQRAFAEGAGWGLFNREK